MQEELLEHLSKTGKPLVVAVVSGSAMDLRKVDALANAVLQVWYPGQDGGEAFAEILFGDFNPSGRLPVTFVRSDADLPPFEDYAMKGRTYRYLETTPLYPFGYGLSYTEFEYSDFSIVQNREDDHEGLTASVLVTNTGSRLGAEVVQIYLRHEEAAVRVPNYQLCGFRRIELASRESRTVVFRIPHSALEVVGEDGISCRGQGKINFFAGGQQPDERSQELIGKKVQEACTFIREHGNDC